jgi:hypothetical protein
MKYQVMLDLTNNEGDKKEAASKPAETEENYEDDDDYDNDFEDDQHLKQEDSKNSTVNIKSD